MSERTEPKIVSAVEPQPPIKCIMYMVGNESWLKPEMRKPRMLIVEDWSNPSGKLSGGGFAVDIHEILVPDGVDGVTTVDGRLYWTRSTAFSDDGPQEAA